MLLKDKRQEIKFNACKLFADEQNLYFLVAPSNRILLVDIVSVASEFTLDPNIHYSSMLYLQFMFY